jgi:hypothetical protein
MLGITDHTVAVYLLVAVAAIALGTRYSAPGAMRVFVFASLFSLFFAMGLLVGHGVAPFPGLWILVACLFTDWTRMYGDWKALLLFTLAPMVVQWVVVTGVSFTVFWLWKRRAA